MIQMWYNIIKHFFTLLIFSIFGTCQAQDFEEITQLPKTIDETSGLESHSNDSYFWTFNDSGGKAELYLIDTKGNLLKKLAINNAWNRDWEDITRDVPGNIYIGNIGNNSNKNKDLCIFKIPNPDTLDSEETKAEIITFNFEDQTEFPPDDQAKYFDCECLMWYDGNLYLATKNRTKPFDGITNLYVLPDEPGNYTAKKIGSFNTGGDDMFAYWITAGDISLDGSRMALLSSDKVWLFYDFEGDAFFEGKNRMITLPHNTQKEGLCFKDNNTLYLTDEEWKGKVGRKLYKLSLEDVDQ